MYPLKFSSISTSGLYLLSLLSLAIAATLISTVQLSGIDFWLQAKIGELIVQNHAIPQTLLFPFTEIAEDPFQAHEWLASVLFYYELNWLGEDYMPLLIGLHGTLLFLLAARLGYLRSGGDPARALISGFMTILLENYRHVMRPELSAVLLMASFWLCLEYFHQRPRLWAGVLATLLMVVWTNIHGSFVLGIALTSIYSFNHMIPLVRQSPYHRDMKRNFILWVGLTTAIAFATLVNPEGLKLWNFVISFGTNEANKVLIEWYPTLDKRLYALPGLWVVLVGWVATIGLCIWRWRRLTSIDILLVLVFSILFFRAIRFPVFFALVSGYVFAGLIPSVSIQSKRYVAIAFFWLGGLACIYVLQFGNVNGLHALGRFDQYRFSPQLVMKLADPAMHGNVFNEMEMGAELIYRAYPRLKPMVDCRFDSYSSDYLDYLNALWHDERLFKEFVVRYNVRYLMMSMDRYRLFEESPRFKTGHWRYYFSDRHVIIMERVTL